MENLTEDERATMQATSLKRKALAIIDDLQRQVDEENVKRVCELSLRYKAHDIITECRKVLGECVQAGSISQSAHQSLEDVLSAVDGRERAKYVKLAADVAPACTVPPPGWTCSRAPGHSGPCATSPSPTPSAEDILRNSLENTKGFCDRAEKRIEELEATLERVRAYERCEAWDADGCPMSLGEILAGTAPAPAQAREDRLQRPVTAHLPIEYWGVNVRAALDRGKKAEATLEGVRVAYDRWQRNDSSSGEFEFEMRAALGSDPAQKGMNWCGKKALYYGLRHYECNVASMREQLVPHLHGETGYSVSVSGVRTCLAKIGLHIVSAAEKAVLDAPAPAAEPTGWEYRARHFEARVSELEADLRAWEKTGEALAQNENTKLAELKQEAGNYCQERDFLQVLVHKAFKILSDDDSSERSRVLCALEVLRGK